MRGLCSCINSFLRLAHPVERRHSKRHNYKLGGCGPSAIVCSNNLQMVVAAFLDQNTNHGIPDGLKKQL